jgi:hypothetical protein
MAVDEALHFAERDRGPAKGRGARGLAAVESLAAEVRRLRGAVEAERMRCLRCCDYYILHANIVKAIESGEEP